MDSTIELLERLEARRKLRELPAALLESRWACEVQVEAVIDAVLAITCNEEHSYERARRIGEWSAQIASALPFAPNTTFARRCGVLAELDPRQLWIIKELRSYAPAVSEYQHGAVFGTLTDECRVASHIVSVAEEFDSRAFPQADGAPASPRAALDVMLASSDDTRRPYIIALRASILRSRAAPKARHRIKSTRAYHAN